MTTLTRCAWCTGEEIYIRYHDDEWGVPEWSAQGLFERLVLEGMQAGLAWITVLKKRVHMRDVFFEFDIERLAGAAEDQIEHWLSDPGIIRHRGKLEAMVGNARLACEHPDFSAWLWSFAPEHAARHDTPRSIPSHTQESGAMSKALKKAGYRFVGPTTCYAFMQSVGMVNDHVADCWRYAPCAEMARNRSTETD